MEFFAKASKISDAFSFGVKNGLEFFWPWVFWKCSKNKPAGFLSWHGALQGHSNLPHALLLELSRYKKQVNCLLSPLHCKQWKSLQNTILSLTIPGPDPPLEKRSTPHISLVTNQFDKFNMALWLHWKKQVTSLLGHLDYTCLEILYWWGIIRINY